MLILSIMVGAVSSIFFVGANICFCFHFFLSLLKPKSGQAIFWHASVPSLWTKCKKAFRKDFFFLSTPAVHRDSYPEKKKIFKKKKKGGDFFCRSWSHSSVIPEPLQSSFSTFFHQVSLLFPSFFTAVCKGAFTKVEFVVSQCHFKVTFFIFEPKFL